MKLSFITAAVLAALTTTASAEVRTLGVNDNQPLPAGKPQRAFVTIEGQLGVASPTGFVGGAASLAVTENIDWSVGAGVNLGGLQLATGLRVHRARASSRTYFGIGASTGRHVDHNWLPTDDGGKHVFEDGRWVNIELGREGGQRGMFTRWAVGVSAMVDSSSCTANDGIRDFSCNDKDAGELFVYPYVSFTVGYRY